MTVKKPENYDEALTAFRTGNLYTESHKYLAAFPKRDRLDKYLVIDGKDKIFYDSLNARHTFTIVIPKNPKE